MKKYRCTSCGHEFEAKFAHTESKTALCPSCFAPAESVYTKVDLAEQLKSALYFAGNEAVKSALSSSGESRAEYHELYKAHMRQAEILSMRIFGE